MQKAEGGFRKQFLEEKATQDTKAIAGSLCWVPRGV